MRCNGFAKACVLRVVRALIVAVAVLGDLVAEGDFVFIVYIVGEFYAVCFALGGTFAVRVFGRCRIGDIVVIAVGRAFAVVDGEEYIVILEAVVEVAVACMV